MPPSTTPVSPTVTCSTRTSPLMVPSTWISPPPEMSPSNTMSAPMLDVPFWGLGAGAERGGSVCGADDICGAGCGPDWGAGVGVGCPGCGWLEFGLLNIVAGLHETEWVLGSAVHPHFVVQM